MINSKGGKLSSSQKCRDGYTGAEQGRTKPRGGEMLMEGDSLEDWHNEPHREIRGPWPRYKVLGTT